MNVADNVSITGCYRMIQSFKIGLKMTVYQRVTLGK